MKLTLGALVFTAMTNGSALATTQSHPCATGTNVSGKIEQADKRKQTFSLKTSNQIFSLTGLESNRLADQLAPQMRVSVFGTEQKTDRYGTTHVQVWIGDNKNWLQGELLKSGQAMLDGSSHSVSPDCLLAMRKAEHMGIRSRSGVWAKNNSILTASNVERLQRKLGHFVVIEGKVLSIGDRKRRLYLNFGQNWSQDFTLSVVKKGKGAFKGSLSLLTGLKEKTVRVRGILEERQGPLIRLFDEAQIEIIDE